MARFIEVQVAEEEDVKVELINVAYVGRIYPNPQLSGKSIIEMSYQSINQSPVYLEVSMPYLQLRALFMGFSENS